MILQGDALIKLQELPAESVDCCVTSPPYFKLRDYGVEGQIGLEETVEEYIEKLVAVFRDGLHECGIDGAHRDVARQNGRNLRRANIFIRTVTAVAR